MSRQNSILGLSEPEKAEFLNIFILMNMFSNKQRMKKCFITSGPGFYATSLYAAVITHKIMYRCAYFHICLLFYIRCLKLGGSCYNVIYVNKGQR